MKTISQFATQYTESNIIFVAGQYEIRINRALDGNITAKHNFNLPAGWTPIPDAFEIDVQSHLTEHGRINQVVIKDASDRVFVSIQNYPHLVTF